MSVARWLKTDTNSNKDISAAVSIGTYTADADRMIVADVSLDQVAGNGDYVIYVTRQINGAGSAYVMLPKTTCAAASGETAIAMQSGPITVRSGDVLTVMVDGLAGDTATPDTVVRWFEMAALRPVVAGRALEVREDGLAFVDVQKWADSEATLDMLLNYNQRNTLAILLRMLEEVSVGENVYERFTAQALEAAPGVAAQDVADALLLAPSAGDPAAGSAMALLTMAAAGGGSTAYSNTITDTGSNPLDGVEVWITSDSGGASTVASTTTDTLGGFTVYLDPGTYYLWLAKGGYNFPNPTTITVS